MREHLRRWGAVYVLVLMFLGSWAGQLFTQAAEFANTAKDHGEPARMSEFWPEFWAATFENWQSEFLQLAVQAILVASFVQAYLFKAEYSADKDDVEQINEKLDRLLER
jgi:hypothetical protein